MACDDPGVVGEEEQAGPVVASMGASVVGQVAVSRLRRPGAVSGIGPGPGGEARWLRFKLPSAGWAGPRWGRWSGA